LLQRNYDGTVHYTDVTPPVLVETAALGPVERMQQVDLATWLPGDILVKADRMSMAHSLEVRVPFLETAVFAAAARLPTSAKLPPCSTATKHALREALRGIVPDPVVHRRKLGFPTPIRVWLRDAMYPWARAILLSSSADVLLDLSHGLALLDAHRLGHGDHSRKIWTLLVFCLWHDIAVAGVAPSPAPASRTAHGVQRRGGEHG